MADKKNHADGLERVMNQLADSVLGLSDDAILAEAIESGVDTAREAEQSRRVLREASKAMETLNTRLANLGHTINSTSWQRGQWGYHNECLNCGASVSFTVATGEMQGRALDGPCTENFQYTIPRREASH
jgi:hypothetical protein